MEENRKRVRFANLSLFPVSSQKLTGYFVRESSYILGCWRTDVEAYRIADKGKVLENRDPQKS